MGQRGDQRLVLTLVIMLVVALGAAVAVAGLQRAQLRSVPLAAPRALPAQGAGSTAVEVSADVWAHPASGPVQDLMARHFGAINAKNYPAWAATVSPVRAAELPEPAWREAYASTTDGTVRISRIDEVGPGRLLALVSFVSVQRPADAPDALRTGRICWRSTYALVGEPMVIEAGNPGSVLRGAC